MSNLPLETSMPTKISVFFINKRLASRPCEYGLSGPVDCSGFVSRTWRSSLRNGLYRPRAGRSATSITSLPSLRCCLWGAAPDSPEFLRHKGKLRISDFVKVGESENSPWLASVATPSGYPSAGCSPAEPASVSPDMVILMLLESSVNLLMVPCSYSGSRKFFRMSLQILLVLL
jgi:hypothetical protein